MQLHGGGREEEKRKRASFLIVASFPFSLSLLLNLQEVKGLGAGRALLLPLSTSKVNFPKINSF